MTLAILLALAGTLTASFFDLRSRRIPNALTATLAVAALIVAAFNGPLAVLTSLAVMLALTLGGTLVYARGGIGGGDIKLAIAACGMLGYPLCLPFLLYSALAGGLLAVFYLLFRPESRPSLSSVALMASGGLSSLGAKRVTMPYALAFTFGATTVALAQSVAPFLRITL